MTPDEHRLAVEEGIRRGLRGRWSDEVIARVFDRVRALPSRPEANEAAYEAAAVTTVVDVLDEHVAEQQRATADYIEFNELLIDQYRRGTTIPESGD